MGFFSFLKYTFIVFAEHLATSWGAPFENHWSRDFQTAKECCYKIKFSLKHCILYFIIVILIRTLEIV
jgi:hypothetical protein